MGGVGAGAARKVQGGCAFWQKDFAAQMAACVRYVNAEYEVDDLCSSFPERLAELRKAKGERLSH